MISFKLFLVLKQTGTYCFMRFHLNYIMLSITIWHSFTMLGQDDFKLDFCKEGISIYSKSNMDKKHIEYKGSLTLDSTALKKVVKTLTDYNNHKNWVYNCKNSSLLNQEGDTTHLYQVCNAMWPFKNRDYVLCLEQKELDNGTIKVDFKSVPDMVSDKKELVRIDEFNGYWKIEKNGSEIIITMYGHFNPKMNLPQAIMKKYARKIPLNTLLNLKQKVTP